MVISRRALAKSRAKTLSIQLPFFVLVPCLLLISMGLMTLGGLAIARMSLVTDPFSGYHYVFESHYKVLEAEHGFECHTDVFQSSDIHVDRNANGYRQCAYNPAAGLFSHITTYSTYTTLSGIPHVIEGTSRITFIVREGAIRIGDLALRWGRPNVYFTDPYISLVWPERGVTASAARTATRQLDYYLPVTRITFYDDMRP